MWWQETFKEEGNWLCPRITLPRAVRQESLVVYEGRLRFQDVLLGWLS